MTIIFMQLSTMSLLSSCTCSLGRRYVRIADAGGRGLIIYAEDIAVMITSDSDVSDLVRI